MDPVPTVEIHQHFLLQQCTLDSKKRQASVSRLRGLKVFRGQPPGQAEAMAGSRRGPQAPAAGRAGEPGACRLHGGDSLQGTDQAIHRGHKTKFIFNL